MTASIFDVLAVLPSGKPSPRLSPEELGSYLRTHAGADGEKERNTRHALRDELYRDGGVDFMNKFIDDVFIDPTVRALRKKWIPYARFNNAIKRIVNELSTVYAVPAKREVGPLEPGPENAKYQAVLQAVRMDERMIDVGRLLNLHRALLIGFRVRQRPDGSREPTLDVATPANVRAVTHPNDDTLVVGWLIRCAHKTARTQTEMPAWTLWTDHESMQLREDFMPIAGSYQEHGLGVCPWVPVSLSPPGPGFWPGCEGEDLVAATVAIWFQNILLLKEAKSATKQTIMAGDGTNTARGQPADSEVILEVGDGQSATTVDMSMDLSLFRDTNEHILNNAAHNYGMSPAIVQHQGVQSAEARELMLIPLRERRMQQQVPLRVFEHTFALVMAAVLAVDLPELAFKTEGWRMEFGESETPLAPLDEQLLFEKRRASGLDNSVAFLRRKHPGLTSEEAMEMLASNVRVELSRNLMLRPLQQVSGSLGASMEEGTTAQDGTPIPAAGAQDTTADLRSIAKEVLSGVE